MPLSLSLSFVVVLFPIALASSWRRVGVGRVIHAYPFDSSVLVLTDLGIVARLAAHNGSVIWRSTPPPGNVQLLSVDLVPDTANGAVIVAASSDEKITAFVVDDGDTLWQVSGCAVRACGGATVTVEACDGALDNVDAATGDAVSDTEHDQCSSEPSSHTWIAGTDNRNWKMPTGKLRSFEDGLLIASKEDAVIWSREEGLAHISQSALYTPRRRPYKESILVALSDLGVIYGLDAMDGGKVLWKSSVTSECGLITGHAEVAVVVCTGHNVTQVFGFGSESGDVLLKETIDNFAAKQAIVEDGCCVGVSQVCVRLLNADGEERTTTASPECAVLEPVPDRGWLLFDKRGTEVHGLKDGQTVWHVDMPTDSVIVAVEAGKRLHPSSSRVRPPAVRVTGDRRVLFKHVDHDIVLVLSENKRESLVHAMLVDSKTGSLYNVVTHPEAAGPVSAVRGESWYVYSFWSTLMLEQEIHIIDMYEPDTEVTRVHHALHRAANSAFGTQVSGALNLPKRAGIDQCLAPTTQGSNQTQCAPDHFETVSEAPKTLVILRSSMLTTKRIVGLDVTETALGLTEPSIAMTLDSGQVAVVSKILLDARRPKDPNGFSPTEYLIPYRPLLNLQSSSPESNYVSFGEYVLGARHLAIAPVYNRESMCQVAVIGMDILFELVHPVGTFDALPEDFSYLSVVAMIFVLGSALFYTQRMKKKTRLSRSW